MIKNRTYWRAGQILALIFLLQVAMSCSGSGANAKRNERHEEEQKATVSWDDKLFGEEFFKDIEAQEISLLPTTEEGWRTFEQRGAYLTKNVAACGYCHGSVPGDPTAPLAGGQILQDSDGKVYAPNITPEKASGIGKWSVKEIADAIRSSIRPDGSVFSEEMHDGYRWLADKDVLAIAFYLKRIAPVKNEVEKRGAGSLSLSSGGKAVEGYVPAPPQTVSTEYGRYLSVHVAGCVRCHRSEEGTFSSSEPFVGTESDEPRKYEAGETPMLGPDIRGKHGALEQWSVDDYVNYLSNGKKPNATAVDGRLCPWPFYRGMTEDDKRAIAILLKRL